MREIDDMPPGKESECIFPVDFFKRFVHHECRCIFHGHQKPDPEHFLKSITSQMWSEFQNEHDYYFGKGAVVDHLERVVVFGYIQGFCHYLFKCLRYYTDHPGDDQLRNAIIRLYHLTFGRRRRYWGDDDLDDLKSYIQILSSNTESIPSPDQEAKSIPEPQKKNGQTPGGPRMPPVSE